MTDRVLASGFLALGFAYVTVVAVFVEPQMGFDSFAAFFDASKVVDGYGSTVWRVESFVYLAFPVAFWVLARASDDPIHRWSGMGAGLLFLMVGAIDRIGIQLPSLITERDALLASVTALLPIRFAIVKSLVACIGVFAWRTTRVGSGSGGIELAWRLLGYVTLGIGVAFLFVFAPAPLVILVWATALTVRHARAPAPS